MAFSARSLARDFTLVPPALIAAEVDAVAAELLEHARFDDYVPILAHRHVRGRLRARMIGSTLTRAA